MPDDYPSSSSTYTNRSHVSLSDTLRDLACSVSSLRQEIRGLGETTKELRDQIGELRQQNKEQNDQVLVLRTQFRVLWAIAGSAGTAGVGAFIMELMRLLKETGPL